MLYKIPLGWSKNKSYQKVCGNSALIIESRSLRKCVQRGKELNRLEAI